MFYSPGGASVIPDRGSSVSEAVEERNHVVWAGNSEELHARGT